MAMMKQTLEVYEQEAEMNAERQAISERSVEWITEHLGQEGWGSDVDPIIRKLLVELADCEAENKDFIQRIQEFSESNDELCKVAAEHAKLLTAIKRAIA